VHESKLATQAGAGQGRINTVFGEKNIWGYIRVPMNIIKHTKCTKKQVILRKGV
jgi:hypothetical protein